MIEIEVACPPADTSSGRAPDGDKWSKTTQETLGGSVVNEVNGVLLKSYHPSDYKKYYCCPLKDYIDFSLTLNL